MLSSRYPSSGLDQKGSLPTRALALVLEWANEHREELMEDWNLCRAKQLPKQIKPLE